MRTPKKKEKKKKKCTGNQENKMNAGEQCSGEHQHCSTATHSATLSILQPFCNRHFAPMVEFCMRPIRQQNGVCENICLAVSVGYY